MNPFHCRIGWLLPSILTATLPAQGGWVQRTPSNAPSNRSYGMLAYDVGRSTSVLFGGWSGGVRNDTWEWNGTNWTARSVATIPPSRCCGGFAYDLGRGRLVMFGGWNTVLDLNDTWEFDGANWTAANPSVQPSVRRLCGMAYDPVGGGVVLFGGGSGVSVLAVSNDTWRWNGTQWTALQPTQAPAARWSFGMGTDLVRGQILLHGGSDQFSSQQATLRDSWTWNGFDWEPLSTTVQPPAVMGFGMAIDWVRGTAMLQGGEVVAQGTWLLAGDTWVADGRQPAPAARSNPAMTYDLNRDRTVLFGGWLGSTAGTNETWEYTSPTVALWQMYGSGCPGSAGTPLLRAANGARPTLGSTFLFELQNAPANGFVALGLGFSRTAWSGGALPASLAALGMPGCTLLASPDALIGTTANAAGVASVPWSLPAAPAFVGLDFFSQAFTLDPPANALGAALSNAGAGRLGVF